MHISLGGLIRLVGLLAVAACAAAIAMARLEPVPLRLRVAGPPAHLLLNGFAIHDGVGEPGILDPESGLVRPLGLPTPDRVDHGSCSPWSDEEGGYQLVGRWERRAAGGHGVAVGLEFGLARYAMPGGRMLDELPLAVPPSSQPCWFPDRTARVLFSGGDGRLYRVAFEGPERREGAPPPVAVLEWEVPPPGETLLIRDPAWPAAPALDGRLIVALSYRPDGPGSSLGPTRLWWLRLDPRATAIVDAGPLSREPVAAADPIGDERFPIVARRPDGTVLLSWMRQRNPSWSWELQVAGLVVDPETGAPALDAGGGHTLCRDPFPAPPAFSADGASLYALVRRPRDASLPGLLKAPNRVVRFDVDPPAAPPAEGG